MVGRRKLRGEVILDDSGQPRVIFRTPNWEHYVQVACNEIRACGADNLQVARRMRAMLLNLRSTLPEHRRAALDTELDLLDWAVKTHFTRPEELALAMSPIRRGWADRRARACKGPVSSQAETPFRRQSR